MFREIYEALAQEISGVNARNVADDIWRHDRTCSFAEYYKSARYCVDKLKDARASDVEIISFPATGKAVYGAYRIQRAWDGHDAELSIVEPAASAERLCSYRDDPYCLAQGSTPTPKGGIEAEVVAIEGGGAEKDYKGVDVKGKLVFSSTAPRGVQDLAKKKGAVGLVTDYMPTNPAVRPTPMDLPDARNWTTLRPIGTLPAFVLTPRQGQNLRKLIGEREGKGGVKLRAWVDARPYDGEHEMVTATIRGRDRDHEVALVAHLYEPGANDNASGAAVMLEMVRVINALIKSGKLPRPRRTIRVWLTHEFQSLSALVYEQPEAIERVIACANVDQIGENQGASGASLMYQDGPDALPSYLNHYTHALMDYLGSRPYTWGNTDSTETRLATVNTPFWMNDNFISDPSVGIPSVAFIAWPDKYYHTSEDTLDKVDPDSMARVTALAATWAYTLASADEAEVLQIAETVVEWSDRFIGRMVGKRLDALPTDSDNLDETATELRDLVEYLRARELAAFDSVAELLTDAQLRRNSTRLAEMRAEVEAAADRWQSRAARRLAVIAHGRGLPAPEVAANKPLTSAEKKAAAIVPYRKIRGIVQNDNLPKKGREAIAAASKGGVPRLLLFWVNGERTLLEICGATKVEGDGPAIPVSRLLRWADAMKLAGVIGFRKG